MKDWVDKFDDESSSLATPSASDVVTEVAIVQPRLLKLVVHQAGCFTRIAKVRSLDGVTSVTRKVDLTEYNDGGDWKVDELYSLLHGYGAVTIMELNRNWKNHQQTILYYLGNAEGCDKYIANEVIQIGSAAELKLMLTQCVEETLKISACESWY